MTKMGAAAARTAGRRRLSQPATPLPAKEPVKIPELEGSRNFAGKFWQACAHHHARARAHTHTHTCHITKALRASCWQRQERALQQEQPRRQSRNAGVAPSNENRQGRDGSPMPAGGSASSIALQADEGGEGLCDVGHGVRSGLGDLKKQEMMSELARVVSMSQVCHVCDVGMCRL